MRLPVAVVDRVQSYRALALTGLYQENRELELVD